MKGKKQLNENTIRRFMKLASIGALTENFLENEEEITEGEEEDPVEEGKAGNMDRKDIANVVPKGGQLSEEEDLEDLEGLEGLEEPEGEPEMAPEEEPALEPEGDVGVGTIDVEEFMQAFQQALEQVTGQEVEVETGEEPPMEEEPPTAEEPPMEPPAAEEPPARNVYEELLEDAGVDIVDEDEVVSEVVRRVAKRLVQNKLRK